jgi:hypothetical protein
MIIDPRDAESKVLPFPALDLIQRVGNVGSANPVRAYDEIGKRIRSIIEGMLPPAWSWEGARVLDFGCRAGRVLRPFVTEAANAEFWGCDIDMRSVE